MPILAVALAGKSTSPSSRMVTNACQPWRSIFVTWPTVTSATRTREFGWMLLTSGSCAWTAKDPGPLPCVPGSGSEFSPRQPQLATTAAIITRVRPILTSHPPAASSCRAGRSRDRRSRPRPDLAACPQLVQRNRAAASPRCR
ncbi:Uncharacterised protein [Mycobacterium tuberculosis]|uniref:Uncharacterized protein n=1 Tax=Mycobacterium tuberculosis TaxID=1773 RepID=A0A654U2G9_MYCTX|nr:Uncharacterised protein [Mycobacterium tuberculosis]